MQIDIDAEMAARPLTVREKMGLYVLLMIFAFIIPARYAHQVKALIDEIKGLMGIKTEK